MRTCVILLPNIWLLRHRRMLVGERSPSSKGLVINFWGQRTVWRRLPESRLVARETAHALLPEPCSFRDFDHLKPARDLRTNYA